MKVVRKVERKYYKYIITPWEQPIMTKDVPTGGDVWGVESNVTQLNHTDCAIYMGFDSNTTSTYFHSISGNTVGYFTIYNPNPLNVTNIAFTSQSGLGSRNSASGTIYGSNDNSTWTVIKTYTNSSTGNFNIDLSDNNSYYNYYKVYSNGVISDTYWTFSNCVFTATQKSPIESTSSDYDYYKNELVCKLPKINDIFYAINQ